jgi:hypothetical protein
MSKKKRHFKTFQATVDCIVYNVLLTATKLSSKSVVIMVTMFRYEKMLMTL